MNYSARSRRTGLTLIEVVAAIAILGTILVGIVLAKSRHTHQLTLAQWKMEAVRAADELLTHWWTRPEGIPMNEEGVIKHTPTMRWKTERVTNPSIEKLGAHVARLEIYTSGARRTELASQDGPLITVDLVLPEPSDPPGQQHGRALEEGAGYE